MGDGGTSLAALCHMSGNHHSIEPQDGRDPQPPGREPRDPDELEPDDGDQRIGHAHPPRDDDDGDDRGYEGVTHRTPEREGEADEEDRAEADMMERLDGDDLMHDDLMHDDLMHMDGPDA